MSKKQHACHRVRSWAVLLLINCLALSEASAEGSGTQTAPPAAQTAQPETSKAQPNAQAPEATPAQPEPSSSPPPTESQGGTTPLPQVTVQPPPSKPRTTSPGVQGVERSATRPPSAPPTNAPSPTAQNPSAAIAATWPASGTQDGRTGAVGIYANSTSVATKINTPLVNLPQ